MFVCLNVCLFFFCFFLFAGVVLIFNYRCSDQTDGRRSPIRCRLRPGEKASRGPDGRPVLPPGIRTRAIEETHGLEREHSLLQETRCRKPGGYVWKRSKESGRSRGGQDKGKGEARYHWSQCAVAEDPGRSVKKQGATWAPKGESSPDSDESKNTQTSTTGAE